MKIIIADDERLARVNVRSMLEELEMPVEIIGEAKDGTELVALIAADPPDVVFVDIRMPVMDGLQAIQHAAHTEHIQWVIISGYSDFAYAQHAIKLQVVDYLLKPVDPDDFRQCMASLWDNQRKKIARRNMEFEKQLMSVLYLSRSEDEVTAADPRSMQANYTAYVLKVDDLPPAEGGHETFYSFMDRMNQMEMNGLQSIHMRRALLILPSGEAVVILALQETNSPHDFIKNYETEMERIAASYRTTSFAVNIEQLACSVSFQELIQKLRSYQEKAEEHQAAAVPVEDPTPPDLIQQMIRYIHQRYAEDIGIGQIAHELDVTPNYLSSLFHRKQGITFMKYLTATRMNKAREILQSDPQIRIHQVAQQVGYYSTRHFTRLFVDYFRCYPSEMRDQSHQATF